MQPAAGTMRLDPQLCKDLLLLFAMLNCLYGAKQSATEQFFKESVSLTHFLYHDVTGPQPVPG